MRYLAPLRTRLYRKIRRDRVTGCWLWTGTTSQYGYGYIKNDEGQRISTHRASWEVHRGPVPLGKVLLHSCDRPACINPSHLRPGTRAENQRDMALKGRSTRGEKNFHSKLTLKHVRAIKRLLVTRTHNALALRFKVTREAISAISQGKTWGWV